MADNQDNNDDYQYADLDTGNNQLDPEFNNELSASETARSSGNISRNKIIRNALITVIIFVLAILIYNFFTAKKTQPVNTTNQPKFVPVVSKPQPATPIIATPIKPPSIDALALEKKISALELSEQNMRSEVNALGNQLTTLNTNINEINSQLGKLNQTVDALAVTVSQQTNAMAMLEARLQKPTRTPERRARYHAPAPIFYIQAVVPGRAWIISNNGATLTVREGSTIPGYGVVKLIDAQQGRVITGSGRVIKFSQDDS